ncbi:PIN domain-containing protein [Cyanobium sp. CH-040]|uniref:PIN domain-containing protein n=1 Tax=Cyanobium sp. CH-040 TaxID=2823708 RepID=UPI0020CBA881|nr:PIN domain-containing protein [Cyanobium sp. CH-040]MCP9928841.1 PIN domain-containing protein [Cyanobium sp. CH-040]
MRAALDTNLLVYAEGFGDGERVNATRELLRQLADADLVVPLQCLGELFRVLTGKAGRSAQQAQEAVLSWMDAFPVLESSAAAWRGAMDLCVAHQLSSWDALVLNVAAEGGARLLLTEDLHPGFSWRGVRVVNPLAAESDPLLDQLRR